MFLGHYLGSSMVMTEPENIVKGIQILSDGIIIGWPNNSLLGWVFAP